jgi:nucleoside-diphosphate-sugar epimerase
VLALGHDGARRSPRRRAHPAGLPRAQGAGRIDIASVAVNIGNSDKVKLTDFVDPFKAECGCPEQRHFMPMQPGDVPATWADATLLRNLTGYAPQTDIRDGVRRFVDWYMDYHR